VVRPGDATEVSALMGAEDYRRKVEGA
jgi:hypothetical protein